MANMDHRQALTDREIEILQMLAEGLSNQQIAEKLCITLRTVKFHTCNIYTKLAVVSRSQAIAWAWKHVELRDLSED